MTLTEFLLARIAEDEVGIMYGDVRTRRECEAKQRVVEICVQAQSAAESIRGVDWPAEVGARGEVERAAYNEGERMADAVLHLLALPYADHPDYDESWRP